MTTIMETTTKHLRKPYRYCIVPLCESTTVKCPDKIFLSVPRSSRRKKWWAAMLKEEEKGKIFSHKTGLTCCQDHFNLEEDLENYWQFKLMGNVHPKLKPGVLPHRFDCQTTWRQRYRPDLVTAGSAVKRLSRSSAEATVTSKTQESCSSGLQELMQYIPIEEVMIVIEEPLPEVKLTANKCVHTYLSTSDKCHQINLRPQLLENESFLSAIKTEPDCDDISSISNNDVEAQVDTKNIKAEHEDKVLMNIKQEEIYIKDEIPTASLAKKPTNDAETQVNMKNIKVKYENEALMNIKPEEIYIKDEIPTKSLAEKPFHCNLCSYKATYNSKLKNHMRIHTGEKPFTCNLCRFKTATRAYLVRHSKIHTGERPYACNLCEFKSIEKKSLTIHNMMTHTGDKPFTCDLCEFRTSLKTTLKLHKKTHTEERPFGCDLCEFRTRTKTTLRNHIKAHMGERPFACDLCEFRCIKKCNLVRHMRVHRGEKNVCM